MLKIGQKREPQRIVLQAAKGKEPEAYVIMAPITAAMRRKANAAMRRVMPEGVGFDELDSGELFDMQDAARRELIRLGIIEWGGIGDARGKPIDLTPDRETRIRTSTKADRPTGSIDMLLDEDDVVEVLDLEYVLPDTLRIAEKNGLSASPAGTGEAATRGKGTASSRAARKGRKRATPKGGAKNAPMPAKRSRPKRGQASGRS